MAVHENDLLIPAAPERLSRPAGNDRRDEP